jgi:DNA repair exonuclease SbcCD ATPase subunit
MMKDWIKRLTVKGFQSHDKTLVEFDEGFNVIVGPTGSGKSALFRSIEFILFNILEDTNFITNGMESFEGSVEFASGKTVTRTRDKKDNIYVLQRGTEEPVKLSGFGEGPVQEVLDFHGIKPIRIGKKDRFISFHSQHEQPFFLSESSADKAKMIGSIAKTDVVDIAIADLAADIKRETIQYNALKRDIKDQKEKVAEFDHIDEMKEDLHRIDHLILMMQLDQHFYI